MFVSHFSQPLLQPLQPGQEQRILSHRGYAIRKSSLNAHQTKKMRDALTMKPAVPDEFSAGIKPFPIYFESPTWWYVPRFWGIAQCGPPDIDVMTAGKPLRPELVFNKTLRAQQILIVEAFREKGSNGLICVPCGIGKTLMAIHEAIRLGRRFLVFVHTEFLADQWANELTDTVPGIRIGRVQGSRVETGDISIAAPTIQDIKSRLRYHKLKLGGTRAELIERLREVEPAPESVEYDCAICLIQTVASRSWPLDTFAGFGVSIYDECHHMAAEYFSKALMSIQTKYRLGLSATPNRMDGLEQVFLWNIGDICYQLKIREADETVEVRVIKFTSADEEYADVPLDVRGKINRAKLCNQLAEYRPRTQSISIELIDALKEGRKLLVLSDRREHLAMFEIEFKQHGFDSIGYYVGGMTTSDRETSATRQIILATFQLASEGMNIKDLNTAALTTPHSNIEQAVGRIFRLKKEERVFPPVIYDVLDTHACLYPQYKKRMAFYKQCKYRVLIKEFGDTTFREKKTKAITHNAVEHGPMFK